MRLWVRRALILAGGGAIGMASAVAVIWFADPLTARTRDGWRSNPMMGAELANPYLRSLAANLGFLPMARTEAIYFRREHGAQARFAETCAYEVVVPPQAARWWSLTIYRPLGGMPDNPTRAWSVDATAGRRRPDGTVAIRVAPDRAGAPNWISTRQAGDFSLWLRLYLPRPGAAAATPMPRIRDLGCGARA